MRSTVVDVAALAGVSPSTVSRVLHEAPDVAPQLRERVLAAVEALHYIPNSAARALREQAATVLGLIIPDITNPFFTLLARGMEDEAQRAGYSVLLANTDQDLGKEIRYTKIASAERLAGVVMAPASFDSGHIRALMRMGTPVVTVDRRLPDIDLDTVTIDNHDAGLRATRHLIEQGYRRIACIAGPASTATGADRLAGYHAALKAANIRPRSRLVVEGDFRVEGGRTATRTLLERDDMDAVFVSNNLMTFGAYEVLAERGRAIGGDGLGFVGSGDLNWPGLATVSLTLILQPAYQLGQVSTRLLLARIKDPERPTDQVIVPAELEIRASSQRSGRPGRGTGSDATRQGPNRQTTKRRSSR